MNEALGRLFTLAGLAVLTGVGVLAWQIGDKWTEANTQSLITSVAMVCGGGAVLVAVLVAMVLGVPMAIRYFGEAGRARQTWEPMPPAMPRRVPQLDGYTNGPPLLTAQRGEGGTWQSMGPGQYDTWDNEEDLSWDEPPAGQPASHTRGRLI
jgi:hypothetical protein